MEEERRRKRLLSEGIDLEQNVSSKDWSIGLDCISKTKKYAQTEILCVSFVGRGWFIIICPTNVFGNCQPIKMHKVSKIGYSFSPKCILNVLKMSLLSKVQ